MMLTSRKGLVHYTSVGSSRSYFSGCIRKRPGPAPGRGNRVNALSLLARVGFSNQCCPPWTHAGTAASSTRLFRFFKTVLQLFHRAQGTKGYVCLSFKTSGEMGNKSRAECWSQAITTG